MPPTELYAFFEPIPSCLALTIAEPRGSFAIDLRSPPANPHGIKIAARALITSYRRRKHSVPATLMSGTPFQLVVWRALCSLPLGATTSYSELARSIGYPTATRAVANACAANRLAFVVPCHRVVRSDGTLGGYRWGIEWKAALIEAEREFCVLPLRELHDITAL